MERVEYQALRKITGTYYGNIKGKLLPVVGEEPGRLGLSLSPRACVWEVGF